MANALQSAANAAFNKLPYGMQRIGMPTILPANGKGSAEMRAGVEEGNPVSPVLVKDQTDFTNPDYTPQLLRHEQTHRIQANWPSKLQNLLPPINPRDPYNFGGTAGLQKINSNPLKLSEEQMAAAEQELQAMQQNGQPIPPAMRKLDRNFQAVPLSVMQPTDPHGKGINTMPRAPGLPPGYNSETGKILQAQNVLPVKPGSANAPDVDWSTAEPISATPEVDWSTAQPISAEGGVPSPAPSRMQTIETGAENLGKGAVKGLLNTESNIGGLLHSLPGIGPALIPQQGLEAEKAYAQPHGTMQQIGKGVEQAGEFLAPGLGEEGTLAKIGENAPKLMPLARIGYSALTSGAVNKAQGGGFGMGAAGGAAGAGIGEGLRALAPSIAESAIGIRKLDRAYGRGPGRAILDETKGFSPGAVAESAQGRLDELNPQLENLANAASVRPRAPIRGFLQAPATEIPLGKAPGPGEMPGGLFPAQPYEPQNVGEARIIRQRNGQIMPFADRNVEFPDASGKLPRARNYNGRMLSQQPTRRAFTTSAIGEVPEVPPISGPGVLLRRPEVSSEPFQFPTTQPNNIASLAPARGVVGQAMGRAATQNAGKEASQLQPLADFLHQRFDTGEAIPQMVSPRQLLDLRRGFGSEFVHNWNPETMPGVAGTARNAYHTLSNELHNVVPETAPIDRRISNLIPVAKRAESAELNAPLGQRVAHRVMAHTGALTGAALGGTAGYEKKGLPGALIGGGIGLIAPELIGSPISQMTIARGLNSPTLQRGLLPLIAGGALQSTRKSKNEPNR